MLTYSNFSFTIHHQDAKSRARLGTLSTPHGAIETPNYIFCGTKAAIKALSPVQMVEAQTDIILANTYHLMLQPGADLIERAGGLHKFTGWHGPMLTDSGGFQVFSMGHGGVTDEVKGRDRGPVNKSLLEISEHGAVFRSYVNGQKINLTPELSMDIQRKLGADLLMQFDECTAYHDTEDYTRDAMRMSQRWGDRSLAQFARHDNGAQALYGIVQGGVYEDQRKESAEYTASRPFFGTAIGGCLGGTNEEMQGIVEWSAPYIHPERPVHFLGIGRMRDVFTFVRLGVDTFDCVIPTRLARHGTALMKGVEGETVNLLNTRFKEDHTSLDERVPVLASQNFTKSYIHHLLKAKEILGLQILAQHNVATINMLMREVREAIKNDSLDALEKEWLVC